MYGFVLTCQEKATIGKDSKGGQRNDEGSGHICGLLSAEQENFEVIEVDKAAAQEVSTKVAKEETEARKVSIEDIEAISSRSSESSNRSSKIQRFGSCALETHFAGKGES